MVSKRINKFIHKNLKFFQHTNKLIIFNLASWKIANPSDTFVQTKLIISGVKMCMNKFLSPFDLIAGFEAIVERFFVFIVVAGLVGLKF